MEDDEKDEAFWSTLFLLKPDTVALRDILDNTDAEFLIHLQVPRIEAIKLNVGSILMCSSINLSNCSSMRWPESRTVKHQPTKMLLM